MTTINRLSRVDTVTAGDVLPVYAQNSGDARGAAISVLVSFLQTAFTYLDVASYIKVAPVTFANLPSAATAGAGARAMCSDSNTATFNATVAGGGANIVPVFSNGTDWKVG
jgi:hypothetical protein